MTDKPIPIDLTRHAGMVAGAREFLRGWTRADGAVVSFVNPVPVGADPAAFGMALVDCVRVAATTYARAVNIPEAEALARIWEGVDAERTAASEPPPERSTDGVIEFVPPQKVN